MNHYVFEHEKLGRLRVIADENDTVFLCANDVARMFEYADPRSAVRHHCRKTVKLKHVTMECKAVDMRVMKFIELKHLPDFARHTLSVNTQVLAQWLQEEILPQIVDVCMAKAI